MDNKYFEYAFKCAEKAFSLNEVPVGAVIVKNDEVISTGHVGAPRGRANCCDLGYCTKKKLFKKRKNVRRNLRKIKLYLPCVFKTLVKKAF